MLLGIPNVFIVFIDTVKCGDILTTVSTCSCGNTFINQLWGKKEVRRIADEREREAGGEKASLDVREQRSNASEETKQAVN